MRIRSLAVILAIATGAVLSVSAHAEPIVRLPSLQDQATRIYEAEVAVWRCQDQRGTARTQVAVAADNLPRSHAYRAWVLNLWTIRKKKCIARLHERDDALRKGRLEQLSTEEIYAAANQEIARGGVYSMRWGDASPLLKSLCYEALDRAFGSRASWARYIVNRESGCNPGAVNTTYSSWNQRAQCIAQMIPAYHSWVDYARCKRDLRYSIEIFFRLSQGGTSTSPWAYY